MVSMRRCSGEEAVAGRDSVHPAPARVRSMVEELLKIEERDIATMKKMIAMHYFEDRQHDGHA